jgi:hypothetical protein
LNQVREIEHSTPRANQDPALWRLLPAANRTAATPQDTGSGDCRIFQLDAAFHTTGVWAAVDRLTELAYLDLLELGESAIIDEHQLELYMVLLKYRDAINPRYLSLMGL